MQHNIKVQELKLKHNSYKNWYDNNSIYFGNKEIKTILTGTYICIEETKILSGTVILISGAMSNFINPEELSTRS